MLERVQRRQPQLFQNSGILVMKCGLTTLETRRLRDQIEVLKILNGYENIERNILFSVKERRRIIRHGVTLASM